MTSQRSILLVEDNPDDEALTLRAFRKSHLGNEVVVVRDGAEAVEYLFRDGVEPPALILLDLKLPKLDGLEVLHRIRADDRTRLVPVVILTTSSEQEDIVASLEGGANAYVRKPVNFADFTAAVNAIGVFWMITSELAPTPPA
jgi:two-component system response regulator